MAGGRRRGTNRSKLNLNINKLSQELRGIILEEGMDILGEVAQMVADEANRRAPTQKDVNGPRRPAKWKNKGKPVDGPIKGNIFAQRSGRIPGTWLICSPAWYSHFVEYGTDPHEIPRAKWQKEIGTEQPHIMTAKFGGKFVKLDWVYNPGAKPKPFLRPAADMAEQFLLQILAKRYGIFNRF